jgi:ketosteroid isomerase-like protein
MGHVELVRRTWLALSKGDLAPLEAALAPDARWRAVEDGPWNCESREAIVEVMRRNLQNGLAGEIVEVQDRGERAIVGFRPERHDENAWPLEDGVRYLVLTLRGDGKIVEMKGCATRADALAYAAASSLRGPTL